MSNADIQSYFLPSEKLLWLGRPKQGLMFSKKDLLQVPFSLMWGGFAIFWESMAVRQVNAPFFFKLWGIPFVLIGLYLIIGRFALDAFIRARTQYAVSNQRILVLREGWFSKLLTMPLERLQTPDLDQSGDGTGTISFENDVQIGYGRRGNIGAWTPALSNIPRFLGITDVRQVFDLIQSARNR